MKKYIACLLCLIFTACTNTADTKEINETAVLTTTSEASSETTVSQTINETTETTTERTYSTFRTDSQTAKYETSPFFNDNIQDAIDKELQILSEHDYPLPVFKIYSGDMLDYNNDGYEDFVLFYALYAQFEFVIFDSQNGNILFDQRIMTDIYDETKIEVYSNDKSEFMFRIVDYVPRDVISLIEETVHITNGTKECVFDTIYDYDTKEFINSDDHDYNNYNNYDDYLKKQEEMLDGYDYVKDLTVYDREVYWSEP